MAKNGKTGWGFIGLCICLALAGCTTRVADQGNCASDADCAGGICRLTEEGAFCTTPEGPDAEEEPTAINPATPTGGESMPMPGTDPATEPGTDPAPEPEIDPVYPAFLDMELFVGAYWEYDVLYEKSNNGEITRQSARVRIELVGQTDVELEGVGVIPFYDAEAAVISGALPERVHDFMAYPRYAVVDGILLAAGYTDTGELSYGIIFDPIAGTINDYGYQGRFSPDRDESFFEGSIAGQSAVVVQEQYHDGGCEVISGIRFCEDYTHDYTYREYYVPGIGFAGFSRTGSSVFSGPAPAVIQSSYTITIAATNLAY